MHRLSLVTLLGALLSLAQTKLVCYEDSLDNPPTLKHSIHHHHPLAGPGVSFLRTKPTSAAVAVKQATTGSISQGAVQALQQFQSSSYLPGSLVGPLAGALSKAVTGQLQKQKALNVINNSGSVTVTVTVTALTPGGTASPYTTSALDIQAAINSAFAAVGLSQGDLTNSTIAALEACLSTVLQAGGLPAGYACLSSSGSSSAGLLSTLDTILQQFVGILPNVILKSTFSAISSSLGALLPASELALVSQIEASISSVVATLSASSSQALIQAGSCYTQAIQQAGNVSSMSCFDATALKTMETAQTAVIESFVGVLPGGLITSVENIIGYTLSNGLNTSSQSLAAQVQAQISNAINSAGNTLSGNTVSQALVLQGCATKLILTGNAAAAKACVTSGTAPGFSTTIVLGISEQFKGYLPSSFFADLIKAAAPLIANVGVNPTHATLAQISKALAKFFNNPRKYGPAYVTCLSQIEGCVLKAIQTSGKVGSVCAGPVAGCAIAPTTRTRLGRRAGEDDAKRQLEVLMREIQRFVYRFEEGQEGDGVGSRGLPFQWQLEDELIKDQFLRHFGRRSGTN